MNWLQKIAEETDNLTPNQKTIDNFNKNKNHEDPGMRAYYSKAELVSIEEIERFIDIDRAEYAAERGGYAQKRLDDLEKSIAEEGIKDIAIITYSQSQRKAYMGEGNHRLAVAKMLGIEAIPVRVIRISDVRADAAMAASGRPYQAEVPGVDPDRFGYVPGDLKPSDIGINIYTQFPPQQSMGQVQSRVWQHWLHKTCQATGTCFRAAAKWAMDNNADVVHGEVTTGEGKRIPHAWAVTKDDQYVMDATTLDKLMPKDKWYDLLQATEHARYDGEKAVIYSIRTMNWGPWREGELEATEESGWQHPGVGDMV